IALLNHPLLFSLLLLLVFTVIEEIGYRLAARNLADLDQNRHEQITASRDALGVLLSLLLGFTLAMALPRYDLRRDLVLSEANDIGTTALRAGLLPSPQKEKIRALLLAYTKTRLEFSAVRYSPEVLQEVQSRSKVLQSQMWVQAEAAAQAQPTPITASFIQ